MKQRLLAAAAVLVLVLAAPWAAQGTELKVGDKAPDFTLLDTNWKEVKLSDYLGRAASKSRKRNSPKRLCRLMCGKASPFRGLPP